MLRTLADLDLEVHVRDRGERPADEPSDLLGEGFAIETRSGCIDSDLRSERRSGGRGKSPQDKSGESADGLRTG